MPDMAKHQRIRAIAYWAWIVLRTRTIYSPVMQCCWRWVIWEISIGHGFINHTKALCVYSSRICSRCWREPAGGLCQPYGCLLLFSLLHVDSDLFLLIMVCYLFAYFDSFCSYSYFHEQYSWWTRRKEFPFYIFAKKSLLLCIFAQCYSLRFYVDFFIDVSKLPAICFCNEILLYRIKLIKTGSASTAIRYLYVCMDRILGTFRDNLILVACVIKGFWLRWS